MSLNLAHWLQARSRTAASIVYPGPAGAAPEIARVAVVIEDHLLVEIAHVHQRPNISVTLRMPATRASTSSRVLYKAKEAREVAGTPRRFISGMVQW